MADERPTAALLRALRAVERGEVEYEIAWAHYKSRWHRPHGVAPMSVQRLVDARLAVVGRHVSAMRHEVLLTDAGRAVLAAHGTEGSRDG